MPSALAEHRLHGDTTAAFAGVIGDLLALARGQSLQGHVKELTDLRSRVAAHRIRVLVLGGAKSGKSTLVNALLGGELTPAAPHRSNSVFVELTHSEDERVDIPGGLAELRDLVTVPGRVTEPFLLARVGTPAPVLARGFEFVDTPGDYLDPGAERRIYEYLAGTEVVIFVKSALYPMTAAEANLLAQAKSAAGENFLLVLNRKDEVPAEDWHRLLEDTRTALRRLAGADDEVFLLSARAALLARADDDHEGVRESGLTQLEASLVARASENVIPAFAREVAVRIRYHLDTIGSLVVDRRSDDDDRDRLATLRDRRDVIVRALHTNIDGLVEEIAGLGTDMLRTQADAIPGWAAAFSPNSLSLLNPMRTKAQVQSAAQEIADHLRSRLDTACTTWLAETLVPHVRTRVQDIASELAASVRLSQTPSPHLVVTLPADLVLSSAFATVVSIVAKALAVRTVLLGRAALTPVVATSPVSLLLGVAVDSMINIYRTRRQYRQLRERVAAEMQRALREQAEQYGNDLADTVRTQLHEIETFVTNRFDENDHLLETTFAANTPSTDAEEVAGRLRDLGKRLNEITVAAGALP